MRSKFIILSIFCVLLNDIRKFAIARPKKPTTVPGCIQKLGVDQFLFDETNTDKYVREASHTTSREEEEDNIPFAPISNTMPTRIAAVTEHPEQDTIYYYSPQEEVTNVSHEHPSSPERDPESDEPPNKESWLGPQTTRGVITEDDVDAPSNFRAATIPTTLRHGSLTKSPQWITRLRPTSVRVQKALAAETSSKSQEQTHFQVKKLILAMIVCSARLHEALNSIKSALLFTETPLYFVILTEEVVRAQISETLSRWTSVTGHRFHFETHTMVYPAQDLEYWKNSYTNCTAPRLFFPDLLPYVDSLIYVDSDTVFLGPVDDLWRVFSEFGEQHIAALVPEHNEDSRDWAWYTRFAKHPFYGDFGLNAGVMLMNLTRMREFNWVGHVQTALRKWKHHILYSDQDVINIIFDYHPLKLRELSCRFNYRSDVTCKEAARHGILLLHGNRRVFHTNDNQMFKAVYDAIDDYVIGTDPLKSFLPNLKLLVAAANTSTKCQHVTSSFLKLPIKTLYKI